MTLKVIQDVVFPTDLKYSILCMYVQKVVMKKQL